VSVAVVSKPRQLCPLSDSRTQQGLSCLSLAPASPSGYAGSSGLHLLRLALDQCFDVLGLTSANRSQPDGYTVLWDDKYVGPHQQEVFNRDVVDISERLMAVVRASPMTLGRTSSTRSPKTRRRWSRKDDRFHADCLTSSIGRSSFIDVTLLSSLVAPDARHPTDGLGVGCIYSVLPADQQLRAPIRFALEVQDVSRSGDETRLQPLPDAQLSIGG
jgi:hypothetical protein